MFRTSGQSLFKFEISLHMRKHFMCCQLPISIPFKKKSINSSFLGEKPPWGVLMKSVLCFLPSFQTKTNLSCTTESRYINNFENKLN